MSKGKSDVQIDRGETAMAVYDAFEQEVFPALFRGESPDKAVEVAASAVTPVVTPNFTAIHTEIYSEAAEPAYDKTTGLVSDHAVGVDFSVAELKKAYEAAAEGETFSLPLTVTQPVTFLQLVWAVLLGAVVFGEAVDSWVVFGGLVIMASVTFITWREAVARRQVTPVVTATKV